MHDFESIKNQQVLLSFLNWGQGHLSRCIDVCRNLILQNNTIVVACTDEDFGILKSYVPSISYISFADYPFAFSGTGNFANDLWKSRKTLTEFIKWEQSEVEKLVKIHNIDIVVSDHRYGFRSTIKPSIFITHQVNLSLKWWQLPVQLIHKNWMNQFSSIWIMDDEQNSLAGKLSRKGKLKNAFYIGHFSRFEKKDGEKTMELGVCNGPYPYNLQLLDKLVQNPDLDVIISSIPHSDKRVVQPKSWKETDELFYKAKTIHSYCGYSTLMDLKRLGCHGNLIPTPGQTEQEYLYELHHL
jgi:hypothetical protein